MKARYRIAPILVLALCGAASAQTATKKAASPALLELTMEVATTNDDGSPQALRVTLKNVGTVTVTMPMLDGGCHPDNGVQIESFWTSTDGQRGSSGGGGCGTTDLPALAERARSRWIRLRPGENMTTMLRVATTGSEAGAVEYWVEYMPPDATSREIEELSQEGFVIPTEKLQTEHWSFEIH